jgi:hypothetical protein
MIATGTFPAIREIVSYRASFPDRWKEFLRQNFPSAARAAKSFAVDDKTARDWWHGRTAPSGFVVALAFKRMPTEAARLLGGWASRLIWGASHG